DQVRPPHRIASGQDEEWRRIAERRHAVDQPASLLRRELARVAMGDRLGATVNARQRAGPRGLPDDDERRVAEGGHRPAGTAAVTGPREPRGRRWRSVRPSAAASASAPAATAPLAAVIAGGAPAAIARARPRMPAVRKPYARRSAAGQASPASVGTGSRPARGA